MPSTKDRTFDLICMGRAAVDFYGEQIGSRLEDAQSMAKYLGGSSANIAYGAARLGLRVAMLTRVGDEHMGRFVREELARAGVDVSHVATDPHRLTGLVVLGIKDRDTFPLIFFRENCADMAISEEDFDAEFIGSARALLITGTHFSTASTDRVSKTAIAHARAAGVRVVIDIDYRPVLWGLTGRGLGETRYIASERVTQHLESILPLADLVVGTEQEVHIAGGTTDTLAALRRIRELTPATIVLKRGPFGCVTFPGPIPATVEDGISAEGIRVDVLNVLGAGDGFLAGFLSTWLRDEPLDACCRTANAAGALVVSRHGCAPAMPTADELRAFLARDPVPARPDRDPWINHLHRVTTRARRWDELHILAFDHRKQLLELAESLGVGADRIAPLKRLIAAGARLTVEELRLEGSAGVIVDDEYGEALLEALTGSGLWLARPVEVPGSRPLAFSAGDNLGLNLRTWPKEHIAKCLVSYRSDDPEPLRAQQLAKLEVLHAACVATEHELLLEVIPPGDAGLETLPQVMEQIYARGIFPDWWKIPAPERRETWTKISTVLERADPYCRGVLLLGLDAPELELERGFAVAAGQGWCKGFAVGRSIFSDPARRWLAGEQGDSETVRGIANNYARLIELWRSHRAPAGLQGETR